MKIAAAQIKPVKGDILKNIENHKIVIEAAINKNVDLIIFPELSITGYEPELAEQLSIDYKDPILDVFQKMADENNISITVGMPTKFNNQLLISSIIFQPKKGREVYSKRHLFPTETAVFSKGDPFCQLEIVQNKISLAICYDLSDPMHSQEAYNSGSNIYTASVLNSVNGIDDDLAKLSNIAEKYHMHVLMANFTGESGGYECAGKSSVWNTNGSLLGQLNSDDEGILIVNTDNDRIEKIYIY
ncbi:carbon-nitrogen hydrolase family protein [Chryseobacterium sp. RP-3-3]|uniref:Carbon-nitrogen hydrolase family protein n=1 Tax=Chryseobacterium antibioticum TaxID=2728847 RepID=A0A7Y0AJ92_9FLAO|nr:carbon-nitrogen hydrolase family protein [Chryseobacterium antibioticum]NML68362.1 carbon-nitrogen hydrolase family protein [Chryseobacterium antibioticum]